MPEYKSDYPGVDSIVIWKKKHCMIIQKLTQLQKYKILLINSIERIRSAAERNNVFILLI